MTTVGTANFMSRRHAIKYYKDHECDLKEVNRKLDDGEIIIGRPARELGTLITVDVDGRYHLRDMNFAELERSCRYVVDDSGNGRPIGSDSYAHVRVSGERYKYKSAFALFKTNWLEIVVAVNSYLDVYLTDDEVCELATDFIKEHYTVSGPARVMRG
jgi:hypothetical protein